MSSDKRHNDCFGQCKDLPQIIIHLGNPLRRLRSHGLHLQAKGGRNKLCPGQMKFTGGNDKAVSPFPCSLE